MTIKELYGVAFDLIEIADSTGETLATLNNAKHIDEGTEEAIFQTYKNCKIEFLEISPNLDSIRATIEEPEEDYNI